MRISDWSSDVCSSDLLRQGRVDGRGKGVDELGPFGAEQPQGAAAMLAEMPLGRAGMGARLAGAFYFCVVDGYVSSPPDLHGPGVAAQVDGIPAATRCLAANRAIAALIGVRGGAGQAEMHGAAMTGTFEAHDESYSRTGIKRAAWRDHSCSVYRPWRHKTICRFAMTPGFRQSRPTDARRPVRRPWPQAHITGAGRSVHPSPAAPLAPAGGCPARPAAHRP